MTIAPSWQNQGHGEPRSLFRFRNSNSNWNGQVAASTHFMMSDSVTSLTIQEFHQLDLRGFFLPSSSREISLIGNKRLLLRSNIFHGLWYPISLTLNDNIIEEFESDISRGIRLRSLVITGSKIEIGTLVRSFRVMNTSQLTKLNLINIGLKTISEALVRYVPFVQQLALSKNTFLNPGCLDSLAGLAKLREIYLDSCNITKAATLHFIRRKKLSTFSISFNNMPQRELKEMICNLIMTYQL
jgi:hypothetical protein